MIKVQVRIITSQARATQHPKQCQIVSRLRQRLTQLHHVQHFLPLPKPHSTMKQIRNTQRAQMFFEFTKRIVSTWNKNGHVFPRKNLRQIIFTKLGSWRTFETNKLFNNHPDLSHGNTIGFFIGCINLIIDVNHFTFRFIIQSWNQLLEFHLITFRRIDRVRDRVKNIVKQMVK